MSQYSLPLRMTRTFFVLLILLSGVLFLFFSCKPEKKRSESPPPQNQPTTSYSNPPPQNQPTTSYYNPFMKETASWPENFASQPAAFHCNVGTDEFGWPGGELKFEYYGPDPKLVRRAGLEFEMELLGNVEETVRSYYEDFDGALVCWEPTKRKFVRLDGTASIPWSERSRLVPRRVITSTSVADIVDIERGYEIRFYNRGQEKNPSEPLGDFTGKPFVTWRIHDISPEPEHFNRVEVVRLAEGMEPEVTELEYHEGENAGWRRWSWKDGKRHVDYTGYTPVEKDSEEKDAFGGPLEHVGDRRFWRRVDDEEGKTVFYSENLCRLYPWGVEVVQERIGLSPVRVLRTHYYYDDKERDGHNYGTAKELVWEDGSWWRLSHTGTIQTTIEPWLNAPPNAPDDQCRVEEVIFGNAQDPRCPPGWTCIIKRIAGIEVARKWEGELGKGNGKEVHQIQAWAPGADMKDPRNLHSWERFDDQWPRAFYLLNDSDSAMARVSADGHGYYRSITEEADGKFTVVTRSGRLARPTEPDEEPEFVSGQRTVELCASNGQVLDRKVFDVASGLEISSANYEYDLYGRELSATHSDGRRRITSYGADGTGQRTEWSDREVSMVLDPNDRVVESKSAMVTTANDYDQEGNLIRETVIGREGGRLVTSYEYDESGKQTAEVTPDGRRTETTRQLLPDGRRRETTVLPDGSSEWVEFNRDRSVARRSGTGGETVEYHYSVEEDGSQTTRISWSVGEDVPEKWEETTRDFLGRVVRIRKSDGGCESREYDSFGRLTKVVSPAGRVTLYAYDHPQYGAIVATDMNQNGVIDFDGPDLVHASNDVYLKTSDGRVVHRSLSWRFMDGVAQLTTQSDTAQDGSFHSLNRLGEVVTHEEITQQGVTRTMRSFHSDGTMSETEWWNGLLQLQLTADGSHIKYKYDEFNRLSEVSDGRSFRMRYVRGENGVTQAVIIQRGEETRTTQYEYDANNRVTVERDPAGREHHYQYDGNGNLVLEFGDIRKVAYQYDHHGRRIARTTWRNETTEGDTTRQDYDAFGNCLRCTYADGTHLDYQYDADGLLISCTSARGIVQTRTYDAACRHIATSYSDQTTGVSWQYDQGGRIVKVEDAAGTHLFCYDEHDNCISETLPQLPGYVLQYAYDEFGRRCGVTLAKGEQTEYSFSVIYDKNGRVGAVRSGADEFRLSGAGDFNGTQWWRGDKLLAEAVISWEQWPNALALRYSVDGNQREIRYAFDLVGQCTKVEFPDGTAQNLAYDRRGRLVAEERFDAAGSAIPGGDYRYSYDDADNRISLQAGSPEQTMRYLINATNQCISLETPNGIEALAYDEDGNLLAWRGWHYTWNAENQLVSAEKDDLRLEFGYDYKGRRFSKKVFAQNTLVSHRVLVYDGELPIAEYDVLDGSVPLATCLWQPSAWLGGLLQCNGKEFCVTGRCGELVAKVDADGHLVEDFNEPHDGMPSKSFTDNLFCFGRSIFDEETGLLYCDGDYCLPEYGIWLNCHK